MQCCTVHCIQVTSCMEDIEEQSKVIVMLVREAPPKIAQKAFGHCPYSFCIPPPHSNGHSGALFSSAAIGAIGHPGKGLDPPPPYGQCPNAFYAIFIGASLIWITINFFKYVTKYIFSHQSIFKTKLTEIGPTCTNEGSPTQIHVRGIWALPVRGGGLDPCPDGLGHFFREEFAKIKWAFAWFWGGLNPCQDGLGHLCSENGSSIRYFPLLTRDLRLARILCGTYIPSKR